MNEIMVFVKVAQLGSFSQAAKQMSLPVSTVSRRVSDLEKALGVALLQRTTRRLQLTPSGDSYYRQCADLLQGFEAAENQLLEMQNSPQGVLKISVPMGLITGRFMDFISQFMRTYPQLEIDLSATNLFVDLVAENVDVAIRAGHLKDSSLVAKRIGTDEPRLVASAEFVKKNGEPRSPQDLVNFNCLTYSPQGIANWILLKGTKKQRVSVRGNLRGNDMQILREMVSRGHGIAILPGMYAKEELKSGEFVGLLPEWKTLPAPVHAVYVHRRFLPARIAVFLKAIESWDESYWR